jgi:hypothetical protein
MLRVQGGQGDSVTWTEAEKLPGIGKGPPVAMDPRVAVSMVLFVIFFTLFFGVYAERGTIKRLWTSTRVLGFRTGPRTLEDLLGDASDV